VPQARVGVRHTIEILSPFTGAYGGKTVSLRVTFPPSTRTIAEVTASGGLPAWDYQRRDFSVVSHPQAGLASIQGFAVAITESGFGLSRCYLSGWRFTS
jgi:hypothetical protein